MSIKKILMIINYLNLTTFSWPINRLCQNQCNLKCTQRCFHLGPKSSQVQVQEGRTLSLGRAYGLNDSLLTHHCVKISQHTATLYCIINLCILKKHILSKCQTANRTCVFLLCKKLWYVNRKPVIDWLALSCIYYAWIFTSTVVHHLV